MSLLRFKRWLSWEILLCNFEDSEQPKSPEGGESKGSSALAHVHPNHLERRCYYPFHLEARYYHQHNLEGRFLNPSRIRYCHPEACSICFKSNIGARYHHSHHLETRSLNPIRITYMRITVQTHIRACWKKWTFPNYEFGKGQYAFYPMKLSLSAEKIKFGIPKFNREGVLQTNTMCPPPGFLDMLK